MQSYEIQPFRNIRPGFGHQSAWQWSGLALVFIALALLVGCGVAPEAAVVPTQAPTQPPLPTPTCAMQAAPFLKEIDPLAREWDDAVTLANSTPRASLSNQIEKLQALRRKVEALDAPECAAAVKAYLVDTMDAMTRGFIAFLGQKSDSQVQALFSVGKDEQAQFAEALQRVKAGKAVPPTEPMLKDGLGVTRAAIQGAYNDRKFTEDSLTTGEPRVMGVTAGGESLVELIGPAENVRQATLSASLGGAGEAKRNALKQELLDFLKRVAPDWNEAEAWIGAAIDAKTDEQTAVTRGRVINLQRTGPARTEYLLVVQVP